MSEGPLVDISHGKIEKQNMFALVSTNLGVSLLIIKTLSKERFLAPGYFQEPFLI